jgi:hypothetical protein
MSTTKISREINHDRRRFCGAAAMTIAAAQAGRFAAVDARASQAELASRRISPQLVPALMRLPEALIGKPRGRNFIR